MSTVLEAAEALRRGGLVLMPTETVYGLAADAADPAAIAAVFEAKGRPRFNPLIAHVTGLEAAERFKWRASGGANNLAAHRAALLLLNASLILRNDWRSGQRRYTTSHGYWKANSRTSSVYNQQR